jgi:hypothetical protein
MPSGLVHYAGPDGFCKDLTDHIPNDSSSITLRSLQMKSVLSFFACVVIALVLICYRVTTAGFATGKPLKITEWDAFGYYLYIPSVLLYDDYTTLKWVDSIDRKYSLLGGTGLPVRQAENGAYVNKYLCGVAVMELPFFYIGHAAAKLSRYPPDGYSPPYQYALAFGIIIYSFLALLVLRSVLLLYYKDTVVAATLILIGLATNYIQYAAVDSGQTHGYIFPYSLCNYQLAQEAYNSMGSHHRVHYWLCHHQQAHRGNYAVYTAALEHAYTRSRKRKMGLCKA